MEVSLAHLQLDHLDLGEDDDIEAPSSTIPGSTALRKTNNDGLLKNGQAMDEDDDDESDEDEEMDDLEDMVGGNDNIKDQLPDIKNITDIATNAKMRTVLQVRLKSHSQFGVGAIVAFGLQS